MSGLRWPLHRNHRYFCLLSPLSFAFWIAFSVTCIAQEKDDVSHKYDDFLSRASWSEISRLTEERNADNLSVIDRMVAGHAALALNHTNRAMCHFSYVSDASSKNRWHKWAVNFADRFPERSISNYFLGDSWARLKKWDEAIKILQRESSSNEVTRLILNALGSVHAITGDADSAIVTLIQTSAIDGALADTFAALGGAYLQVEGFEGAVHAFNSALEIDPASIAALAGRANARLVLAVRHQKDPNASAQHWELAKKDFSRLSGYANECSSPEWTRLIGETISAAASLSSRVFDEVALKEAEITPGTPMSEIRRRIDNLTPNQVAVLKAAAPDWIASNKIARALPDMSATVKWSKKKGFEVSAEASIKIDRNNTRTNLSHQIKVAEYLYKRHPTIRPTPFMNPIRAWMVGHTDIGQEFSRPGGVTFKGIDAANINMVAWKIPFIYTLLYGTTEPFLIAEQGTNQQ